MIRIGIVGVGFMGMIHYLAAKRVPGVKVTAIATRDPRKRAGDWTMIQGNFGPRGGHEDLTGVATFETAAELIACKDVDLVDICLPNDQHPESALAALAGGKHVLVEKAIALSLGDADRMLRAAAEAKRHLMVAHVLPFFPDFGFALSLIESGEHGKLLAAHFRRHISPPDWSAFMRDNQTSGGPIVDLHIHDTHFVLLACGKPQAVQSRGLVRDGIVEYVATQYLFDGAAPVVTATCGSISQKSRPFTHGLELYLERATVHLEAGMPLTVYTADGSSTPELGSVDPIDSFAAELAAAGRSIESGTVAPRLSAKHARDALALCLIERESVLSGQTVRLA